MKTLTPQFYGTVRNGKLTLQNATKFGGYLTTLEGKEVALIVKKAEYVRSNAENRYYWGVIVRMVSDEMGIIPEEAHEFLKGLFLKVGVEAQGKRYEIARSTANLSIADFEDYCEKCREWGANELSLVIPFPNEIVFDDD